MALYLLNHGVNGENQEEIEAVCSGADISIEYKNGEQIVILNGENVNAMIRTEQVGNMASKFSVHPFLPSIFTQANAKKNCLQPAQKNSVFDVHLQVS